MGDLKTFLYEFCSKQKLPQPIYNITSGRNPSRPSFICEVFLSTMTYNSCHFTHFTNFIKISIFFIPQGVDYLEPLLYTFYRFR